MFFVFFFREQTVKTPRAFHFADTEQSRLNLFEFCGVIFSLTNGIISAKLYLKE